MNSGQMILPYPGLRAFTRDESVMFFGRENCVDAMIERLAATRFLAVLGASGSGKSSLVRTGLFDGLELGFFARAGARWKIVETYPGGAPLKNLARALARASEDGDRPEDIEELLIQGRRSLIEWAGGTRLTPGQNLLLLVDQFEELFRYADYAAREEAENFVALLLESIRSSELPIYVVITMRSEFLGACALIPGLAEQINAGFYLTPRMSREECRQAIEGPAAVSGFDIEPALTNRILNDMAALAPWEEERGVVQGQILSRRADQLPLMQHLLNRLWLIDHEKEGDGTLTLTVGDYEKVGGLRGALNAHGEQMLASLSDADRALVPKVFRCLASGPDPTNAVRRPCRFGAIEQEILASHVTSEDAARRIVEAFRSPGCNFLQPVASMPLTPDTVVDISHESLIRQWSELSGWLVDEAQAGANWRRLLMAEVAHRKGEGDLLSGSALSTLLLWWGSEGPNPIWAERHGGHYGEVEEFVSRSTSAASTIREREKRRDRNARRRLIMFAGGSSLLALIFSGLLIYLNIQGKSVEKANFALKEAIAEKQRAETESQQIVRRAHSEAESIARDSSRRLTEANNSLTLAQSEAKKAYLKARATELAINEAEAQIKQKQDEVNAEKIRANQLLLEVDSKEALLVRQQDDYKVNIEPQIRSLRRLNTYCNQEGLNEHACEIVRGANGANPG